MSDEHLVNKPPMAESPILVAIFRLGVPALLGAILTYAAAINSAQRDQGKQLAQVQGQLAVFTQINSDFGVRLAHIEQAQEENSKNISGLNGRVLVLEAEHPKP